MADLGSGYSLIEFTGLDFFITRDLSLSQLDISRSLGCLFSHFCSNLTLIREIKRERERRGGRSPPFFVPFFLFEYKFREEGDFNSWVLKFRSLAVFSF